MDTNTIDLGEYQNNIEELDALEYIRYENIFKVYSVENGGSEYFIYNILNKINFPENISSEYLDEYVTKSRMALTTISYEIYDNIESWWILYLLNKESMGLMCVDSGKTLKFIKPNYISIVYEKMNELRQLNTF